LPRENRSNLVAAVENQLRDTASASESAARDAAPAAQDALRTLKAAALAATALLRGERPPADDLPPLQIPLVSGSTRDLVGLLVAEGVRLAEEGDPLRRADYCLDLGDQLVQTILQVAAASDAEEARLLGEHLGDVLARGVAANLKRAEVEGDARRLAEYQRLGERGVKVAAVLRQKLDQAPRRSRIGLERAVEAARRGFALTAEAAREKPAGKGQGQIQIQGQGQREGPSSPLEEKPSRPAPPK
jgi:hypothetical protein